MINLELHRFGFGKNSTLGTLSIDGEFFCFTLEDERRQVKVKHETCIAPGTYEIILRDAGGMNEKYLSRYPELHKGMLWLQKVPNFEFIYIHKGNKESHTSGCILVGDVPVILPDGEFEIARSEVAYLRLYKLLVEQKVAIHIVEDERHNG